MDQFTIRKVTNNLALHRSKAEKLLAKASSTNKRVAVSAARMSLKTDWRKQKKTSLLC